MEAKKVTLTLDLHDDKDKQKAIKTVSKISGIDSIAMDMKAMKLTVVGDIDPVVVVNRLRKHWNASIFFVGPAKEPEKKKDDKEKGDGKKEGGGGGDKQKVSNDHMAAYNPYVMPYYYNYPHHVVTYNPHVSYPQHATTHYPLMATPCYAQEENPIGCVIC